MKKKENAKSSIGIDLGTTFSAAAIYESDGETKVIPNLDGETLTPSVVNLHDETKPVVGAGALNQIALHPESTARLFKRTIGKFDATGAEIPAFVHPRSGKAYSPVALAAFVLAFIVKGVEAALGRKVDGAVISVPAYFDAPAREATRRAGEMAGLKVLAIINEPTAAALTFGLDKGATGKSLVYDLGGGTFDCTLLDIQNGEFNVLATDGDRNTGGSDIDNLLMNKVAAAMKDQHRVEISPEKDLVLWYEIMMKCEVAKKVLSQAGSASFMVSAEGKRLIFEISRADFDALIAPIVEKTRTIVDRALTAASLKPADIKDVVLVGGSSRIPLVREMLANRFGRPARTDINPDEAIARGAAIFAACKAADAGLAVVDSTGRPVLPPPIEVNDVTAHPLGCLALVNGVERNCVIIPANTTLPATKVESFGLSHPHQAAAKVTITSGPHHAMPAECTQYGDIVLQNLSPRPCDQEDIEVKYGFTADGTLDVAITDKVSGKTTSEVKRGLNGLVGGINKS